MIPPVPFAIRLQQVARVLRWSVGVMVLSFAAAWLGAVRSSPLTIRIAVIAGAAGFIGATLCFVWLAIQAVSRRRQGRG